MVPFGLALSGILAWGVAAAWGGFLRRDGGWLVAGFALLAGYSWLNLQVANMFSREFRVPWESAAIIGTLWIAAAAGTWGALRDPAPKPGTSVRGWSRAGALAALFLSLVALFHLGLVAALPRGGRWVTGEYVAGLLALTALAIGAAWLAWGGLAFRQRRAMAGLAGVLLLHALVLAYVTRHFGEYLLDQPAPPFWPVVTHATVTWGVALVGFLVSRETASAVTRRGRSSSRTG